MKIRAGPAFIYLATLLPSLDQYTLVDCPSVYIADVAHEFSVI